MTAGIPGTGIGTMYCLGLALLMPFHELYVSACGRSSIERWRAVAHQFINAVGILLSLAAVSWLVRRVADAMITAWAAAHPAQPAMTQSAEHAHHMAASGAATLAWVTVAVLAFVIGGVSCAGTAYTWWVRRTPMTPQFRNPIGVGAIRHRLVEVGEER